MNFYYKFSILAMFAICCFAQLASAGKIYTWMDENGQVQYSDRPPIRGKYMEKSVQTRPGVNSASGQHGLRQGELNLLRKYDSREADVVASRRAVSKQYKNKKKDCITAREKYSNALRNPRSMGLEYKELAKKIYHQMKEVCL